MKHLITALATFAMTLTAQAGDRPFADFKYIIENETIVGQENKDTKCSVKAEWQANGDLLISASLKYKNNKASKHQVLFSAAKDVEYTIQHNEDDESEYAITQSTDTSSDPHDRTYISESFTVYQDASGLTRVSLQVMDVNEHSDPSEIYNLVCEPTE